MIFRLDYARLCTINGDIFTLANHLGVRVPPDFLLQLQNYNNEELASLTLFEDVLPTFSKLESLGIEIGICSTKGTITLLIGRVVPFNWPNISVIGKIDMDQAK